MLEKMRELIADQLNVDPSEVVELVMNLEEEYGIEIPTEDLETLKTVGDVMNYLKDHGIEE